VIYTVRFRYIVALILLLSLTGCQFAPPRSEGFDPAPVEDGDQIRPSPGTGKAALSLLAKAQTAAKAGELDVAEAQLERALRIEPRNAVLWHYMAKLRLYQGRLSEAAGLAAKSNSLEREDRQLQANNWRIIAHARHQQGDLAGAQAAQQHVNTLSK